MRIPHLRWYIAALLFTATVINYVDRQALSILAPALTRQLKLSPIQYAGSPTGTITFNNTSGTAIGTATSFTVTAGQIFSASLPFNRIAASGTRTEVIGVIARTVSTSSTTTQPPCDLRYSLETYDTSTGASHVYISGAGGGGFGGGPGR